MSGFNTNNRAVKWLDHRLPIFTFMHHELHEYPTPRNLSYMWNFGSLAGICLLYTSPSPRDGLLSRMPSSA